MRVVIVGCGRVGAGLVKVLGRGDREVVVIDHDPAVFDRLGELSKSQRLVGDAVDQNVLERAGIESADALAAVTGRDEINTVVARLATRRFHVPRVVARIYDPRTAALYARLGVRTISPVAWGIERLAELLTFTELAPISSIGGGGVDMVAVRIPARLAGRPAGELEVPGEVRVVAVDRHGRVRLATEHTRLEPGDVAHIAVSSDAVAELHELLDH